MQSALFDLDMIKAQCDRKAKETFRIDTGRSKCLLQIQPYRHADGSMSWQVRKIFEIRPYPNPYSYGGMWHSPTVRTLEEAQHAADIWPEAAEGWGGPFGEKDSPSWVSLGALREQFEKHGLIRVEWLEEISQE